MRRLLPRGLAAALSLTAVLTLPATAPAATSVISGALPGARGATIMALGRDGTGVSRKLAASGRFTLRLPAQRSRQATLQLIGRGGAYLGPVVLAAAKGRAYTALSGRSVKLGKLRMRAGFAQVVRALPRGTVDRRVAALATRSGKPVGAGRLGLYRRAGAAHASAIQGEDGASPGTDTDHDGIPNLADADDDGDLVLDGADPQSAASNAGLFSTFYADLARTLNVNAAGVTTADIDGVLRDNGFAVNFFFDEGRFAGRTIRGAHVDCFTLLYCRPGDGTAVFSGMSESTAPRGGRWVDMNADGSGYPNLERIVSHDGHPAWVAGINPRVGSADIHPGDTFDVVFDSDAGAIHVPTVLSAYLVTTPALASWTTGGVTHPVTYPVAGGAAGTDANPIQLTSDTVSLAFWRPQRAGIRGAESEPFIDVGHLHYGVVPSVGGDGGREIGCKGFYSAPGGGLAEGAASRDAFADQLTPFQDSADDTAPSSARTLSFTVDVAGCLRANGIDPTHRRVWLSLTAASAPRPGGMDRAVQRFAVQMP